MCIIRCSKCTLFPKTNQAEQSRSKVAPMFSQIKTVKNGPEELYDFKTE